MLRKTYWGAIFSLTLISPSFAGFYLGAGIGPEYTQFTQKSHVFDNFGNFDVLDQENFSGAGIFGNFLGGYSWIYKRGYLAGEANFNPSSVQYKLENKEYVHKTLSKSSFTIHYSEGISALAGALVNENAVVYARVGYQNGHIKLNNSDPTVHSFTANRSGIRYGVGMRYNWTNQWSLMADYSQTNYDKFRSHVYEPIGGVTKNARIYPVSAQVAFGIIYNFAQSQAVFIK